MIAGGSIVVQLGGCAALIRFPLVLETLQLVVQYLPANGHDDIGVVVPLDRPRSQASHTSCTPLPH